MSFEHNVLFSVLYRGKECEEDTPAAGIRRVSRIQRRRGVFPGRPPTHHARLHTMPGRPQPCSKVYGASLQDASSSSRHRH